MRLDVFLKQSRIVKRRAMAKELCEDGAVNVNGRQARAGKEVSVGDRLSLRLWSRLLEIEIEQIPERAVFHGRLANLIPPRVGKAGGRGLRKKNQETGDRRGREDGGQAAVIFRS